MGMKYTITTLLLIYIWHEEKLFICFHAMENVVICTNQLPNSVWDCFLLQRKTLQKRKGRKKLCIWLYFWEGNNYLYWMQCVVQDSWLFVDLMLYLWGVCSLKGFKHDFTGFDMYVNINRKWENTAFLWFSNMM